LGNGGQKFMTVIYINGLHLLFSFLITDIEMLAVISFLMSTEERERDSSKSLNVNVQTDLSIVIDCFMHAANFTDIPVPM
jgi:hypothetical protein